MISQIVDKIKVLISNIFLNQKETKADNKVEKKYYCRTRRYFGACRLPFFK